MRFVASLVCLVKIVESGVVGVYIALIKATIVVLLVDNIFIF